MTAMNFINYKHSINSSDPNVVKLQQMAKTTKKTFRFTLGKNQQELKRLHLLNNILEKNYNYEDNYWFKNFIEVRKDLNQISQNVTPNYVYKKKEECENDNLIDSNSSSTLSSTSLLSDCSNLIDRNINNKEESTINRNGTKIFRSSKGEYNQRKLEHLDTINKPDDFCQNSSESMKIHSNPTPNQFSFVASKDGQFLFPFSYIRSYTSMVNPDNDKDCNELKRFKLKSSLETRSLSTVNKSANNQRQTLSLARINLDLLDNSNLNLINNKSIRRPRKTIASTNEILAKLKNLNTTLKNCKEQQEINFKFEDRNTRYGSEVKSTKSKHLKQLKLISKFEALKK